MTAHDHRRPVPGCFRCELSADEAPKRIQRKRTKGWRMPENARYVGRPGVWGNPYRVVGEEIVQHEDGRDWWLGSDDAARWAVEWFRADLIAGRLAYDVTHVQGALRGRDLACWCSPDAWCHADVLLEIANEEVR